MKKVEGYMTKNGVFFMSEEDALREESKCTFEEEVRKFANRCGSSYSECQVIERTILENSEELWIILRDFYSVK